MPLFALCPTQKTEAHEFLCSPKGPCFGPPWDTRRHGKDHPKQWQGEVLQHKNPRYNPTKAHNFENAGLAHSAEAVREGQVLREQLAFGGLVHTPQVMDDMERSYFSRNMLLATKVVQKGPK